MTPDQAEAREERVAIMTVEGVSEEDAQAYCDTLPHEYGRREQVFTQQDIFAPNVSHSRSE